MKEGISKTENIENIFENLKKEKIIFLDSIKGKCDKEKYERITKLLNEWESVAEKELQNIARMQLEKLKVRAVESLKNNFNTMMEIAKIDFNS